MFDTNFYINEVERLTALIPKYDEDGKYYRQLTYVLKSKLELGDTKDKNNTFFVHGIRKIGKTTMLIQLYHYFSSKGLKCIYLDIDMMQVDLLSEYGKAISFNRYLDGIFRVVDDELYDIVFIDEACKSHESLKLANMLRNRRSKASYVLMGSSSIAMKNLASACGRGSVLEMYEENLLEFKFKQQATSLDQSPYNIDSLSDEDINLFHSYIESLDTELEDVAKSIEELIHDTIRSNYRYDLDERLLNVTKEDINTVLAIICDCYIKQLNKNINKFNSMIPHDKLLKLEDNTLNAKALYKELMEVKYFNPTYDVRTRGINKKKLVIILDFLRASGLVSYSLALGSDKTFEQCIETGELEHIYMLVSSNKVALAIYKDCLNKVYELGGTGERYSLLDLFLELDYKVNLKGMVIECIIHNALAQALPNEFVGKYRTSSGDSELDIVINHDFAIEVKSGKVAENDFKRVEKYRNLANLIGIKEVLLTTSDETKLVDNVLIINYIELILLANSLNAEKDSYQELRKAFNMRKNSFSRFSLLTD